jgi:hypothetical protein
VGIFIFILIVVCGLAGVTFMQVAARGVLVVTVPYPAEVARSVVRESFGLVWDKFAEGDGTDNFQARLRRHPPTLSAEYEPAEDGGCVVKLWASRFVSYYGVMGHAQLIWRKRRHVARKLQGAVPADLAER